MTRGEETDFWIKYYNKGKCFDTVLKVLITGGNIRFTNAETPSFFRPILMSIPGILQGFTLSYENITTIVYQLTKLGRFDPGFVLNSEWFMTKMYYDLLEEDIKEENKRREEEAEQQEKLYQEQNQMMKNNPMGSMMPSMPSMPAMPSLNDFNSNSFND